MFIKLVCYFYNLKNFTLSHIIIDAEVIDDVIYTITDDERVDRCILSGAVGKKVLKNYYANILIYYSLVEYNDKAVVAFKEYLLLNITELSDMIKDSIAALRNCGCEIV